MSNFWPAIAVPTTVKMPEPITAPIPRAVSETGPSVFFKRRSGASESEISLSMDLQQKSWFLFCSVPVVSAVDDFGNRPLSLDSAKFEDQSLQDG